MSGMCGVYIPTRCPEVCATCSRSWTFSLTAKYLPTHLRGTGVRFSLCGCGYTRERSWGRD